MDYPIITCTLLACYLSMKPGNVWQLFDFPVSVGFALNPSLASTTFKKIESFRKPESRKQLLMRILGGKKGSKADGKEETKEEEESNSTPELQSSQSDPLAGNLVEPDDKDGSGFEETPDLEDEHEQENEESIRSEQAVPFHTDLKSSGFDVKKSNLGKRFDIVDDEEKEDGPIIEPSFTSSLSSSSSIAVSLSPLELEVGKFPF